MQTPDKPSEPRIEFPTIRMSAFDRLAARLNALDTEHVSGVWRVTKAAADARAV